MLTPLGLVLGRVVAKQVTASAYANAAFSRARIARSTPVPPRNVMRVLMVSSSVEPRRSLLRRQRHLVTNPTDGQLAPYRESLLIDDPNSILRSTRDIERAVVVYGGQVIGGRA
jgi:hypothetical protein